MMQQQVVRFFKPLWCEDGSRVRGGAISASSALSGGEQMSVLSSSPRLLWTPPCSSFRSSPPFSIICHFVKSPSPQRRTVLPRPCCHGEMEIISVKELADGFLHLSFGASANASKVDELSSSHGELMSMKVSIPPRPQSHFKKQLPFPVAGVRRKKRHAGNVQPEEAGELASLQRPTSLLSRPKSCFVKRSPIPVRKGIRSGLFLKHDVQSKQAEGLNGFNKVGEGSSSKKEEGRTRPPSSFAKRSPVPVRVAVPALAPDNRKGGGSSNGSADAAIKGPHPSRPKSSFLRRSPVVKLATQVERKVSYQEDEILKGNEAALHKEIVDMRHLPVVEAKPSQDQQLGRLDREVLKTMDPLTLKEISLESVDLGRMTVKMLKSIARSRGVKGFSKLNKSELVERLAKLRELS